MTVPCPYCGEAVPVTFDHADPRERDLLGEHCDSCFLPFEIDDRGPLGQDGERIATKTLDRVADILRARGPMKIQNLTLPLGLPEFAGIRNLRVAMEADGRFRLIQPEDPDATFITALRWTLR
jgi:hypothetical protein